MSKLIEIVGMALGGLSLFAVCFMAFVTMSGTPLHEVAGIGQFFDAPPTESPPSPAGGSEPERSPEPRPAPEVVASSLGAMGTWSLPSPYTQVELKGLADELKNRLRQAEMRTGALDEREARIAEQSQLLAERFEALDALRTDLEAFQSELNLRELEVERTEEASVQREESRWSDVAAVLASLDEALAGERLVEYPPEEAARILRAMSPDQASVILNQVTDRWKEYVDAYTGHQKEPQAGRRRP